MTSPNLGPAARQMADVMKAAEKQVRGEIEKLRKKIRDKLPEKQRKRFDKNWSKAKDTRTQSDAVYFLVEVVWYRVKQEEPDVDPEYRGILDELGLLMTMLRGLETLENLEHHFDALGKAYGS